jgi:CheY-like chemotaxis protein
MQPSDDTRKDPAQPSVLVVDDEAILRRIVGLMLTRAGYEVDTAAGGVEALEKTTTSRPDLITLDVMMPDMNGLEVVEHFAQSGILGSVPVILLTAMRKNGSPELVHATSLPGVHFLAKPFTQDQLLEATRNALAPVDKTALPLPL